MTSVPKCLFAERPRLDAENFIRVIEALYLCRGWAVAVAVAVSWDENAADIAA